VEPAVADAAEYVSVDRMMGEEVGSLEQYWRPLCVVSGRTRRSLPSASRKVSVSIAVGSLLPDWRHEEMVGDDHMTWAGERMVSVACGLYRKGW